MRTQWSQSGEDWMKMTLSDWMDRTPSVWSGKSFGDLMRTTPSDWWAMMAAPPSAGGMGTWPWAPPMSGVQPRRHHHGEWRQPGHDDERSEMRHHHHGCCRRCGHEPCECWCCIGDVDLAVYSRVGEQRVVPIVVENERRRDKQITLELSAWTTRGGKAAPVTTVLLDPMTFTLASCGEQKVTLVVKTNDLTTGGTGTNTPAADVDDCVVATADLRLVGCDQRPLRIALAILPRDCDPFRVDCGCTCC